MAALDFLYRPRWDEMVDVASRLGEQVLNFFLTVQDRYGGRCWGAGYRDLRAKVLASLPPTT
jgi:hypothetical protein